MLGKKSMPEPWADRDFVAFRETRLPRFSGSVDPALIFGERGENKENTASAYGGKRNVFGKNSAPKVRPLGVELGQGHPDPLFSTDKGRWSRPGRIRADRPLIEISGLIRGGGSWEDRTTDTDDPVIVLTLAKASSIYIYPKRTLKHLHDIAGFSDLSETSTIYPSPSTAPTAARKLHEELINRVAYNVVIWNPEPPLSKGSLTAAATFYINLFEATCSVRTRAAAGGGPENLFPPVGRFGPAAPM